MPGWFRKKGSRSKEGSQQLQQQDISINPQGKKDVIKKKSSSKDKSKAKSFDEAAALTPLHNQISPRGEPFARGSSGGFTGFDSDSGDKRLPVPRPWLGDHEVVGFGFGSGSGWGSVSSVSSSGSSGEDHPMIGGNDYRANANTSHFGGYNRSSLEHRTNGEIKFNIRSRSPGPGSRSPGPGSRSPGPGSRSPGPGSRSPGPGSRSPGPGSRSPGPGSRSPGPRSRSPGPGSRSPGPRSRSPVPGSRAASRLPSPLQPMLGAASLDCASGKPEDGKGQCHPLPLPPGSPTSSSSLTSARTNGMNENTLVTPSKWKKGKLLGRGTFGHVYLGFNSESGQMCAIKEVGVFSDDQTSKESLKQLNQEINLLSQLSHQNIVRYYGSELSEETLSVYLEYVSGGSIHKLLQDYGHFKEPVIQNYTRQILSGLAYLHGKNTAHRDIKGANILVDPNGEIKLADFGMAKHITACSSMLSFKGSPYWMAPEVVMNTNGYSLAVDIWSLGCTILEMATSKPPWSQYEGVAAIFKIGNSKEMPDIPNNLSNDAKSFITLCLQRDPSARPTASQLLDHPFICDQATVRVANIIITRDAFSFDGSCTLPVFEPHSIITKDSSNGDHAMNPVVSNKGVPRRDDVRMITSLPVSPCSSPLRCNGPAHKSCFLSPPHPAYALAGQNGYNLNDYSLYPVRPSKLDAQDPIFDASLLKVQAPGASPRRRLI